MAEPHELTATALAAAIRDGTVTATQAVEACLERIAVREGLIHAWAHLDADGALARARDLDDGPPTGPLHGVPIGVKDIMDTADMPTACGSPIYAHRRPEWDASCVALARAAGAVVIGKTVTTQFAYHTPGPTVNPHNRNHTPGGSSSGSAAAVADHMVPLAFGSQTAASVIRPAAFCGVAGFKPSFARHSLAGVKALAHSLDTLGWMARAVDDLALIRAALLGEEAVPLAPPDRQLRIGLCRTAQWGLADAAMQAALEGAATRLADAGADVTDVVLPAPFDGLVEAQLAVMGFEARQDLAHERLAHWDRLTPQFHELFAVADKVTVDEYEAAQALAAHCRADFSEAMGGCDLLIAPSARGEAPEGLNSTGDAVMSRMWTLLHAPSVTLPCGEGSNGLPLGIQLVAPCGTDRALLAAAKWVEGALRD